MKRTSNAKLRRTLAMIAALTMLLSCLTGCKKKKDDNDVVVDPPSASESTAPTQDTSVPETEAPTETTAPAVTTIWGTVNTNNLNIRTTPSVTGPIAGQFDAGDRVEILEQQSGDGYNWGKTDKGWIRMDFVTLDGQNTDTKTEESSTPTEGSSTTTTPEVSGTPTNKSGTVTANELNIRKGPSSDYDAVGKYKKGDKVTITETKNNWGKTDKGWISMKYVEVSGSSSSSTDSTTTDPKYTTLVTDGSTKSLGKVKITIGSLNVRYGPGSKYEVVKRVHEGDSLTYYQKSGDWVRITDGWIYTKGYTDMGGTTSGGSTSSSGSTGTGVTTSGLNIRKEPNAKSDKVGAYQEGTKVTILETKDGWGRTDKGWIKLSYVKMDSTSSSTDTKTENKTGTNTTFKKGSATVEVNSSLTIRKEAKSTAEKVGTYKNGDKVTITEVSGEWGKTDKGWINLKYVKYN